MSTSSRHSNASRSPSRSPARRSPMREPADPTRQPPQEDLRLLMQELTQNVTTMGRQLCRPDPMPDAHPVVIDEGDPAFNWTRLAQPPSTAFPKATTGQIQRLAAGLLAKLPLLTGRDHHEVAFLLTMASDYPQLPPALADSVYQRMNLLYIATHHGWHNAIAASGSSGASVPVFPPGFQPQPLQRTAYATRRAQDPGPTRGTQRGRTRGGRRQQPIASQS